MKRKLKRDLIPSLTANGEKVGVYVMSWKDDGYTREGVEYEMPEGAEILLGEMSPEKADKILKLWNSKE